jgi:catechol 2,3-dioxygenase-like lactoylglutathione lyase family enzyme
MAVTAVQLFSLPVTDQDRARDFYVDVLGFELVNDSEMGPGMRWEQMLPPEAATSVTLVTWFPTMAPGSTKGTVLETDDFDAELVRLRGLGMVIEGDIQDALWGKYITFDDPDGNGIVLQQTAGG